VEKKLARVAVDIMRVCIESRDRHSVLAGQKRDQGKTIEAAQHHRLMHEYDSLLNAFIGIFRSHNLDPVTVGRVARD